MLFSRTINRLLSFETKELGRGTSIREIDAAEQRLHVKLSESYKAFLQRFGWGGVEHIQLCGLGEGVPDYLNLVYVTESERADAEPQLPSYLVPLMNDGAGNHYCLDTRRYREGECPVVFWDHELGGEPT